jgi:hypothetical protein
MSFIPTSLFDAKLFLLAHMMQLEVICVLPPFLDYLHQFDPQTNSHDVGFNV